MAQPGYFVYGNIQPAAHFYRKNAQQNVQVSSNHHHPVNGNSDHRQTTAVKFPAFSALPFLNRNGKLHKSYPHINFRGISNDQSKPVVQKPNRQSTKKQKNDTPNTPSILHRRFCDFVLRRNEDNRVYRSESFRFIQKTDSLQLLPHLSVGLNKYRKKRLQEVPVSEDYLEPVDFVLETRCADGSKVGSDGDEESGSGGPYNAPYYYSDTIKEPTYTSPFCSWRQSCGDLRVEETSSSSEERLSRERAGDQRRLSRSSRFRDRSSSETPMARKRYETAFIPSSSHHPSHSTSPDVDSLLLAIESSCLVGHRRSEAAAGEENFNEGNRVGGGEEEVGRRPELTLNCSEVRRDPSISYCQSSGNHSHSIIHTSGSTTTNSSPLLSDKNSKPTMPLSEPLPQKRYSNIPSSTYSSGPSTATSLTSCRPSDKRILMTMMKDTSVSSLESIDSTKSEDLHGHSRFGGLSSRPAGGGVRQGLPTSKLLSPISDKSPLEPLSQTANDGNEPQGLPSSSSHFHHHYHYHNQNSNLINAAELTNVPWDMPKLKRRLALLADSGISLDCPGNSQGEGFSFGSSETRGLRGPETHEYSRSSSHIRGNGALAQSQSNIDSSSNVYNSCKGGGGGGGGGGDGKYGQHPHSLHLSFDNGLVQDEYYEDPSLEGSNHVDLRVEKGGHCSNSNWERSSCPQIAGNNVTGNISNRPKSLSNWVQNVTSVQVHVSGSEQPRQQGKPDRCRMKLDFGGSMINNPITRYEIDPTIELEAQEWFHGAITRSEAENILRATKEGSFLVRNCESSSFNRYSLSLKSARGFIHIRIEPNSLGTFSLGEQEFPSVPHLVLHFMCHRLPIKGAEHVKLLYPVITQLL